MSPGGEGDGEGFVVFEGEFDGTVNDVWVAEREVDIIVYMDVCGVVLEDMLEDGDGRDVIFCEVLRALEDFSAVVVCYACDEFGFCGNDNMVDEGGGAEGFDADTDEGFFVEGKDIFVGEAF